MALASPLPGVPGALGTKFTGVFRRLPGEHDLEHFELVGTSFSVLLAGLSVPDFFTGYDLLVMDDAPCVLGKGDFTRIVPLNVDRCFNDLVVEVCAGTGGLGLGCSQLKGQVSVSLDFCQLACDQLRLHGRAPVLCADLCEDDSKYLLHTHVGSDAVCLVSGFPCPPHSTQGFARGADDPRHQVLVEILRTGYLLQAHSMILECTPQAQFDPAVRRCLEDLCQLMGWQVCDSTSVLSHQWPSRRHRWWAFLCPASWTMASLPKWPETSQFNAISNLFPFWGCWSESDEQDLRLRQCELDAFHNVSYGNDQRLLSMEDRAPTLLHSYGSPLDPCPCGCRPMGFHTSSLLRKGLRGCYILSELDGAPRYLHPQEMGALLGFPADTHYIQPPRSALCLLGLVASPLQALWTYSALRSAALALTPTDAYAVALTALQKFQHDLITGHMARWMSQPALPGELCVHVDDEPDIRLRVWGSTTVADLIQAEQYACPSGSLLGLCLGDLPLSAATRLAPLRFRTDCRLCTHSVAPPVHLDTLVIGICADSQLHVQFVASGTFVFQVLLTCEICPSRVLAVWTSDGRSLPLDFRLWHSLNLQVDLQFHTDLVAFGMDFPAGSEGLSASSVHAVARGLFLLRYGACQTRPLLGDPASLHALATQGWTSVQSASFKIAYELSDGSLLLLVPLQQHWYLLWGFLQDDQLSWICFDGLCSSAYRVVLDFLSTLMATLDLPFMGCTTVRVFPQRHPHTCGTIALCHLMRLLGLRYDFALDCGLSMPQALLALQPTSDSILAFGQGPKDLASRLTALLTDKGVPADAAPDRAQAVLKALSTTAVTDALASKNPWATLKGLASRPSSRIRLVQEHELRLHIDQQSQQRGGHVSNAKSKKTPKGSSKPLPPVDPASLQLVAGSFIDEADEPLPQLQFTQVCNDAHGIAFCSFRDAQPFIEAGTTISATTLGLLINTEVPQELWQSANMEHMRFPAICAATSEPLLVQGTLLTLSDGAIRRPKPKMPDLEVQDSSVLKVQVFRDELTSAWDDWTAGPIRQLLQEMPIFRFCPAAGDNCGSDCHFYHPPIDETIHNVIMDVWSRGYFNAQGKSTKPAQADSFQCLLRVPTIALETLLRNVHCGIYLEPRAPTTRGPHEDFHVIWLSGQSREQVLHRLKTGTFGLGLARLHARYGIRVKASQAAKAHAELKPDEEFCDVAIRRVYSLFPLPHGVTRQQLQQMLQAWKWDARPLQALRGNHDGQSWTVGSSKDPPSLVLHGFDRDILVTLQKDMAVTPIEKNVVASQRTRQFLKEGMAAGSSKSDPWVGGEDPWKSWTGTSAPSSTAPMKTSAATASRMDQIAKTLRDELMPKSPVDPPPGFESTETAKLQKLEVSVTELKAQGQHFQQWFAEAGQRMGQTEGQLQQLQQYVEQQGHVLTAQIGQVQEEVTNKTELLQGQLQSSLAGMNRDFDSVLDSKLSKQFDRFEALLAKRAKTDNSSWLSRPGCCAATSSMPVFRWLLFWILGPWLLASGLQLPYSDFGSEDAAVGSSLEFSAPWTWYGAHYICSSPTGGQRFGEARHPGPDDAQLLPFELPPLEAQHLRVGCSNPCGLRGREPLAAALGPGVWSFSETHLTAAAQRQATRAICAAGRAQQRHLRVHHGAPVGLRPNSSTAGTWSGVSVISDYPGQVLQVPWPAGAFESGRTLLTRHFVGSASIQMGSVYGYPSSPTWPRHKELTQALLRAFTTELVVGSSGIRFILGDHNCPSDAAGEFEIWKRFGWIECQTLAFERWFQDPVSTCKNSSQVDHIWLSPEAAALCRQVKVVPIFPDHHTLMVDLDTACATPTLRAWPMPSAIPWEEIDLEAWHASYAPAPLPPGLSSDDFFAQWCHQWESSLEGHCSLQPDCQLPPRCKGRGQHTAPQLASAAPPVMRAARPGEAALRSDFASRMLLRWYKQLRRLQSYLHAIRAAKMTESAICYRLSLWVAIRSAVGFAGGFEHWWNHRSHASAASPPHLPQEPPPADYAEAIYEEFHWHFRRLESWMIRQRSSLLKLKYDKTCKALFTELRDPSRDQLDLLWSSVDFTILAVDFDACQVHLDAVPAEPLHGQWRWQNSLLELQSQDSDVLTFASLPSQLEAGDCLQHQIVLADESSIHQALLDLWTPRWQRASSLDASMWQRIVDFITAYMPRLTFPDPDWSLGNWHSVLKCFPPRAARGVDGVSVLDLLSLPSAASTQLLEFLQSMDGSTISWPSQLCYGTVINLAKIDGAHLAQHFRPVVIFGTIYRAWSRLCARPLLRQLAKVVPDSALGFLPGRECAQVWLQLQSFIELCCQQNLSLGGFSTDLEKCFNNIGRGPLMHLATHLGFPAAILGPWQSFLESNVRAFVVRSAHSAAVTSTSGLPEGCAMSVVGMVLIDWCFHVYMHALTPSVHAFSYVDNISVAGHDPLMVVSAFFSTICFFQLWGLPLDYAKTFCWGTNLASRRILQHLGLQQCTDAAELGGSMTYGKRRHNRCLRARGTALEAKWQRLRASRSPQQFKLAILPSVFWAAALHGCAGCPIALNYVADLRKRAVRALRLMTAGCNSMLRLSFAPQTQADPGFYQVWQTVLTFVRVCRKTPKILECWQLWWRDHSGRASHGPFGQLLDMLILVRWTLLAPPLVMDHSGLTHDLLLMDNKQMYVLLQDAWFQRVASVACTRPSMRTVQGLDVHLMLNYNRELTSHEWSLQSALQCGCFVDKWTHGRFDVTAQRVCPECLAPNTHEHLLVCRKYVALREKHALSSSWLLAQPRHFALHLLCSRSPYLDSLRMYFAGISDVVDDFVSAPNSHAIQHVFTDGSCFADGREGVHQGAWAVWNASTGAVVASGHLAGLPQTISRAELVAVLSAMRWANFYECRCHLWIDALTIHQGLQHRLAGGVTAAGDAMCDLWFAVDYEIANGGVGRITSSWIPSHLLESACETPLEEWVAFHNNQVDTIAVRMNQTRPTWVLTLIQDQLTWDEDWSGRLRSLRRYYFDIFAVTHAERTERHVIPVDSSDDDEGPLYSFSDLLDIDLRDFVQNFTDVAGYPIHFVQQILQWIQAHETSNVRVQPISFIELTFALLESDDIVWPYRNPMTSAWQWDRHHTQFTRPTLCYYHGIVRSVLLGVIQMFCRFSPLMRQLDRASLGITMPLDGIPVSFDPAYKAGIGALVSRYTASRPIRRAADLARPA